MGVQSRALHLLRTLRRSLPDGGNQTVARVRTGGVEERRLPATVPLRAVQLPRLQSSFRRPEEIDYAIALLKHNGDSRAENHRESFETCPECKRQKCLVPSDRIELTRHMKEAI